MFDARYKGGIDLNTLDTRAHNDASRSFEVPVEGLLVVESAYT